MEENEYCTIPEEQLCRKCQVKQIDRSENSNSILCRECREEQIKYPFPKKMIPAAVIIVLLMVVALVKTPKILGYYKTYELSKEQAETGEIYQALIDMKTVVEAYPDSIPIAERAVELAMDHGYYEFAAYLIDGYLVGREVKESTYTKMENYQELLNRYYNTYDKLDELAQSLDGTESQEEIASFMKSELLKCLGDYDQYPALIYYCLATVTEDPEEAEGYLESSIYEDSRLTMSVTTLGTIKRRRGDLEGARQEYQSVLDRDKSDPDTLRAMGILCLLEDDLEQGLLYVQDAYDKNPDASYVKETLIIALMENGNKKEAETLKKQFEEEGEEFDDNFAQYLNGEVDLYHYYVDEGQEA